MKKLVSMAGGLVFMATATNAATIYTNNFDGALGAEWSGITTTESIQGYPSPFGVNFLRNTTTGNPASKSTLTLTGLGPHSFIDVNFLAAFIDSWDGDTADFFNVDVNGVNVFHVSSANASGGGTYGGTDVAGGCVGRGFNGTWCDRGFDIGPDPALTVANNTSTVVIDFYANGPGWQGGTDESWAIDNLQVVADIATVTGVPEPGTLTLLGMGLLGLGARRRKAKA